MNVGDFLVFREETQVLNAFLDEEKLIDDFFILHGGVFEIFDVCAFLFHLAKDVPEFLFVGDKVLRLWDLHGGIQKFSNL